MKYFSRWASLPAFFATCLLPSTVGAVDVFTDGVFSSTAALGDVGEVQGAPTNILGAFRSYETANFGSATGSVSASLSAGGPLQLTDNAGGMGTYWFGYGNASSAGSLNADFVGGTGWDSLVFAVDVVGGSGSLKLSLNSGPDTFAFSDLNVSNSGDYAFLYSEVTNAIPTFDLTSVDGVTFEMESLAPDSSFTISGFTRETTIPEPSTGLLLVLGSLTLLRRKRA